MKNFINNYLRQAIYVIILSVISLYSIYIEYGTTVLINSIFIYSMGHISGMYYYYILTQITKDKQ